MSDEPKRISEAELRGIERVQPHEDLELLVKVRRLADEVRRLRGLILAATERRQGEMSLTMVTGWGEGETALMEEAHAIREELKP